MNDTPKRFQSTLPARGATAPAGTGARNSRISIHAPRTGSDGEAVDSLRAVRDFNPRSPHGERPVRRRPAPCRRWNFNPRSPHGERHRRKDARAMLNPFQSTLPARGATSGWMTIGRRRRSISIHAPRTGSDLVSRSPTSAYVNFNPRSPHGERPRKVTILSIRIIGFAQKVYHKTVLLRISLAENAVILPEKPRNPVRTSLQKAGGLRFARAIRAARPYSISSPSGA